MKKSPLIGRRTILAEVGPQYLGKIIEWRNDKELNRYINQPFELTMQLEEKWYNEQYLPDDSQMLYVMVDRERDIPFGTMGYVNLDMEKKLCISARLMAGEREYQGSPHLIEGLILFFDHLYNELGIKTIYSHVVRENAPSLRLQKKLGFVENTRSPLFPERLHDSSFPMVEIIGVKDRYEAERRKVIEVLDSIS